ALDAALSALDDARGHLDAALSAADHDPRELDRIEERLFALRAAGRKYNVAVDNLAALNAQHAADLAVIDAGAEDVKRLETAAREAQAAYTKAAGALSAARKKAAAKLDKAVAVTHAPQVAARAERHYVITKDALARGKRVATSITEVAAERRREEIARMLAGAEITEEARKAAERLLKAAG